MLKKMPKVKNNLSNISFNWYIVILIVAFLMYTLVVSSKEYMTQGEHFQIKKDDQCLRVNPKGTTIKHKDGVAMTGCDQADGFQLWKYVPNDKRIMTTNGTVNYCLDYDGKEFKVTDCYPKDKQNWINRMFTFNTLKNKSVDVSIGIDKTKDCVNTVNKGSNQVSCGDQAATFNVYYI